MYETTAEALQDLMNRGYLIYESLVDKTWTIQKIATTVDPSPTLPGGSTSIVGFSCQKEALNKVIGWVSGPRKREYIVEVQFNDGLGPKFDNLGVVSATSPEEAELYATEKAAYHFASKSFKWSCRIKPI